MSGYRARNPHDDAGNDLEAAERQERAEQEAGSWFAYATKPQLARYTERMRLARDVAHRGAPRWEREKALAEAEFKATTTEAAALCEETVAHFLANGGQVLEELAERWEVLAAKTNAVLAQAAE